MDDEGTKIIPGCFKGVTLYEPKAPLSEAAGTFMPSEVSPLTDCAVAPWQFPGYCQCVLAGGAPEKCFAQAMEREAKAVGAKIASTGCCGAGRMRMSPPPFYVTGWAEMSYPYGDVSYGGYGMEAWSARKKPLRPLSSSSRCSLGCARSSRRRWTASTCASSRSEAVA